MYARLDIPTDASQPFTDYTRWRLKVDDVGNHTWHYLADDQLTAWPQTKIDKYWIGLPFVSIVKMLETLQSTD